MSVSVSSVEAARPEALTTAAGGPRRQDHAAEHHDRRPASKRSATCKTAGRAWPPTRHWRGPRSTCPDRSSCGSADDHPAGPADRRFAPHSGQVGALGNRGSLRAKGWQVSDDGVATPPPNLPEPLKGTAAAWTAIIQRLLTIFDEVDSQTAAGLPDFGPSRRTSSSHLKTATTGSTKSLRSTRSAKIPAGHTKSTSRRGWTRSPVKRSRIRS